MDAKIFGAFVAQRRKEIGLTQAELAAKLHVTDKAVSKWERGAGLPAIDTIAPLAEALGVSIAALMRSEPDAYASSDAAASDAVRNTLDLAAQKQAELRRILLVAVSAAFFVLLVAFLRRFGGKEVLYVIVPRIGLAAGVALLFAAGIQKTGGQSYRRTLFAGVCLALVTAAFILLTSVPFYPAFQKPVNSLSQVQRTAFSDVPAIRYPNFDAAGMEVPEYALLLDGRTLVSKPIGYLVSGTQIHGSVKVQYCVSAQRGEATDAPPRVSEVELMNDFGISEGLSYDVTFSTGGCGYTISGSYRSPGITEAQKTAVDAAVRSCVGTLYEQIS